MIDRLGRGGDTAADGMAADTLFGGVFENAVHVTLLAP
jgi:hypothetical protein